MRCLRVLGIDPGLAYTGFAVADIDVSTRTIAKVREVGVIVTERSKLRKIRKTSDDLERAKEQANGLRALVTQQAIDVIGYEMASTMRYKLPTFSFGVMMGVVATLDRPIIEVLPYEVKRAATGNRNATKGDIIRWAVDLTGDLCLDWPTSSKRNQVGVFYRGRSVTLAAEHPADALAVVQAAIGTEQFHLACAMSSRPARPLRETHSRIAAG